MKHFFTSLFALLLLLSLEPGTALRAQVLDPSFQPTTLKTAYVGGIQTGVQRIIVQPDGKTLVAGGFDFANGTLMSKIMRLNADGTLDTGFNPGGTGANGFIGAMALQPDGKLIIVGGFTVYNGVPAFSQARLNTNGTLDTSFASLPVSNLMQMGAVAIQTDGKILVGGGLAGDGLANTLYRLNYDGTLDATFTPTSAISYAGAFVRAILVQADGKIILGGYNITKNVPNSVVRLNADGSVDTSFNTGLINTVSSMALQADGKILLAGTQLSGPNAPGVIRLLSNGTRDATFISGSVTSATGTSSVVNSLLLLRNGTILVGGNFTQYNGVARGRIARLLPDGTLDASFTTGTGANNGVLSLAELAGGQLLAGGSLTQYDGNAKTGLARLSAGGADDTSFNPPVLEGRGSINSVAPLASGKLLIQGSFANFNGTALTGSVASVRRLNADGTLDQSYSTVYGSPYAVQPDGSFYIVYYASPSTSTQLSLGRVLASGALDNSFSSSPYVAANANGVSALRGVVVQPDGRVIAFGNFATYGSSARSGIARLNADGTVDDSFVPPAAISTVQRAVTSAIIQSNGKTVLTYQEGPIGSGPGGLGNPVLIRLNANGSLDNTFATGTGPGANDYVGVLPQADGKLLVTGITSFNGQATPYGAIRLTADGAIDNSFNNLSAVYGLRLPLADGHILATLGNYGATTLVRLNNDGSRDASFAALSTPGSIFVGDDYSPSYVQQPDGKVIAFSSFRTIAGQQRIGLARILLNVVTATRAAIAARPLIVYPNPASQQLTVVLPALAQPTQATLRSLTGQVVRQWALPTRSPEATLDLNMVAAGLYVLQVLGPGGMYQQKVVVTR